MKKDLNIQQRLAVSILYVVTLLTLIFLFTRNFDFLTDGTPYNLIFVSAALLLVFGKYLTEPFFTKPVDTITNLTAILLTLLAVKDRSAFIAYDEFLWAVVALLVMALVSILFSNRIKPTWLNNLQRIIYLTVTTLGSSKWAFSVMYILVLISFFTQRPAEFWILLTFFVFVITQFAYEDLVRYITKVLFQLKQGKAVSLLGTAIGKENPFLFKVESVLSSVGSSATKVGNLVYIQAENKCGLLGVIANEKSLIHGAWLTVYLLSTDNRAFCYSFKTRSIFLTEDLFSPNNQVYGISIDELSDEARKEVESNEIYKNTSNIIGYVAQGSNTNRIKFEVLPGLTGTATIINEGLIVHAQIHGEVCLYQIIDGQTDEESLEKHDSSGYTIGVAQKLGRYDKTTRELKVIKWLPDIYSPVYLSTARSAKKQPASVGILPGTKLALDIKDADSLITHNTAILGILGIGKSMLTFELIQKASNQTSAKIICLDITGEYALELPKYGMSLRDFDDTDLNAKLASDYTTINKDRQKGGNHGVFEQEIKKIIKDFLSADESVLVLNPELYDVSKQTNEVKPKKVGPSPNDWEDQAPMVDLSIAEKTRIIAESTLSICRELGKTPEARCLIVFEEAHSLIPEWNSSANEGDSTASSGTAKVILQGRKYGLGSFIITQRTANISKSILNQCNTIFALRIFDDTGKQFLENYVGADYANALPTLEERHAVVVGKALKLKQPVIIQLNDKDEVIVQPEASD